MRCRKMIIDTETIKDWLKNFVEDEENKKQMSVNIYLKIWAKIDEIEDEINYGEVISKKE
jgi:hypothetical protein